MRLRIRAGRAVVRRGQQKRSAQQDAPEVPGWEFIGDGGYQHRDTGAILHVEVYDLMDGKPSKWDLSYWGEKLKGKLRKLEELPSLLKKMEAQIPKIEEKAKKSLKAPPGWKFVGWAGSGDIEWHRELPKSNALSAVVTTMDVDEFMEGDPVEFHVSVDDNGGYRQRNILKKTVKMSIKDYLSKMKALTQKLDKIEPLAVG